MSPEARALIQRYYNALNRRDFATLDDLLSVDLVHHGVPGGDRNAVKEMQRELHRGFPDLVHQVEDMIVEGDRVAIRTKTQGTHLGLFLGHPPSGRKFAVQALSLHRIRDGAISEIWEVFDTISMLQQIGLYAAVRSVPATLGDVGSASPSPVRGPGHMSGRRPPGPAADVSLSEIRSNPLEFLQNLTCEHGDYVRYVCNGRETILLNQPVAIRHVMQDRQRIYSKLNTPDLLLLRPMLGDGLLTTEGEIWKRDRQWLQPALARRRMERAATLIVQVAEEMLARWQMRPQPGTPVDIVREMSRLTLEIAARVLLSADFASRSEKFGDAMSVLNEFMGQSRSDGPDSARAFADALAFIRRTVQQAILARRFYDTGEDDLLGALLQAQRAHGDSGQHLIDQAVTILLAGHETTAKALSWTFALLGREPAALAKVLAEVDGHSGTDAGSTPGLPHLRYTRAVIDEALRLYPPIWMLTRTALQDDEIAEYAIPAGALVAISPYLIHRHPNYWDHPDRFIPERFLVGEARWNDHYIPFGHGPRYCVGKFFALLEMPLVLATVLRRFALTLTAGHAIEPEALVTLRPRNGLPMIAIPRGGSSSCFDPEMIGDPGLAP
jgi:steroid delta-isomerase-like uncharacterized protein